MENPEKLSFLKLSQMFELNSEKKYVKECIDIVKNHDCLFNPLVSLPYDRTLSLYELRLSIARDGNRLDANYLLDFEETVKNIRNNKSDLIGITSLSGNELSYLIFYEPASELIRGILRAASSIANKENWINEDIAKGLGPGFQKYSKGMLVRDWKITPDL